MSAEPAAPGGDTICLASLIFTRTVNTGGDRKVVQMYMPQWVHEVVSLVFVLGGAVVQCSSIAILDLRIYHQVALPVLPGEGRAFCRG